MSHSSAPGEQSSIPSPRPLQAKSGGHPNAPSSRPATAHAEPLNIYPPIAPAIGHAPGQQQHGYPQSSPENLSQGQPRGFGVHSILNPSSESGQYASAGAGQVPATGASYPLLALPSASPRSRKRTEPASPTRTQHATSSTVAGRRVMTPKSPSTRAASSGGRRNPTFHATGPPLQALTGPEPRIYTAEPGSADIPALPPLSTTSRTTLPSLQATELWPNQSRTIAGQAGPGPGTTQTASPSTSHTSQSQTEQTSPAFRYGAMPAAQQPSASFRQQQMPMEYSTNLGPRGRPETYQAGQPAYQMTFETDDGPMIVPVELDLQQASKMADEKRKRNAGASARFRARRKEKEREASHTIAQLQQELREAQERGEFYRNERNYIRDFAIRHVGIQLPPRPPSPLFTRLTVQPASLHDPGGPGEEIGRARSDSAPAAQRRRTGDYQPQFAGPTQQSPVSQPFVAGYGPTPALSLPPPPPPQAPGPYASPRSLPPGPTVPPTTGQRSQSSYDPFRKDAYDRSWNPGR